MIILSIETSCDDTAISLLEAKGKNIKILANASNSQIAIHAPFGGVFPALAKREHQKNLPILLAEVLKALKSPALNPKIDLIAVTSGPGLEPALWTGIVFAQELAKKWSVPVVPINHMEGHIVSVLAKEKGKFEIKKFKNPMIALLVSGGHTELVLSKKWLEYQIVGQTLDDAAGEAFDKVARMLGLPYPGGPRISELAEKQRERKQHFKKSSDSSHVMFSLPRPMLHSKNLDFSFSGLKTAVLYLVRDLQREDLNILQNDKIKQQIALEFENAVVETLVAKTQKAVQKYKAKTIIVAGGVSANKYLKEEIKRNFKDKKVLLPALKLTGDNSIMIGLAAYLKYKAKKQKTIKPEKIKADGSLKL